MQGALRAEREHFAAANGWCGARPFIEPEIVAVTRGILEVPERFAVAGLEAVHHLLVLQTVKEDQFAPGDGWSAEACPNRMLPKNGWTCGWPGRGQIVARINSVAIRAEELRPVAAVNVDREAEA